MIQEKRKMFKNWNILLVVITYCLVIVGTFIVRTGVISSVHSFAQSEIGWPFFGFTIFMFLLSLFWLAKRWDDLKTENHLDSLLSREAAFLLNNFVIMAILAATFWGTFFPIFSELFTGQKVTVGEPFYEKVNGPLFAVLVLLMGVAPLTMWHRTHIQRLGRMLWKPAVFSLLVAVGLFFLDITNWIALLGYWIITLSLTLTLLEFWKGVWARMRSKGENPFSALAALIGRDRRRYGGYIIHLGVLVMAFGIVSNEVYQQETQIRLARGDMAALGDYQLVFNGIEQYAGRDDLMITEATAEVYQNGRLVTTLHPRTELYTRTNQPMTIPDARSTFGEDFYVLLVNWEGTSNDASTFRLFLNPLINWVWAGGFIFIVGTLIAGWPDAVDRKLSVAAASRQRVPAGAAGGD
jgi:cytochrome c-type biogenesis protein CcmF